MVQIKMSYLNKFDGYRILIKNVLSMSVLRGSEYLIALISMPFLIKTLGPEKFGSIVFMQGVIQYFNIFVEYGFNMVAPREIAKCKDNIEIKSIFSTVLMSKLVLFSLITIVTLFIIIIINFFGYDIFMNNYMLFFVVYISVIGNLIFPIWFFQGMEKMEYIAKCKLLSIIVITICIFNYIKGPEDYILAAFLLSVTVLITGIFSWYIILRKYSWILGCSSKTQIKVCLIDGWNIFVASLAVNIYTNSNIVLLKLFTNDIVVGYFGCAVKIIEALKGLVWPFSQAIYPYISKLFIESKKQLIIFVNIILKLAGVVGLLISLLIFFIANDIVTVLFSDKYLESVAILKIFSIIPICVLISIFSGTILLAIGEQIVYSRILLWASIIDIIMAVPITYFFGADGMATVICIVELFVTICMVYRLFNINMLLLWGKKKYEY